MHSFFFHGSFLNGKRSGRVRHTIGDVIDAFVVETMSRFFCRFYVRPASLTTIFNVANEEPRSLRSFLPPVYDVASILDDLENERLFLLLLFSFSSFANRYRWWTSGGGRSRGWVTSNGYA